MTIGKRIGLAFLAPLAILLAVAAVSWWTTYRLVETAETVTRTHEMIEKLEGLITTLENAETEQRGFILTEDDAFLGPYQADKSGWEQHVADVKELTSDPAQKDRLEDLKSLIKQRFEVLQKGIDLRKSEMGQKGLDAALPVIKTGGRQLMDQVRSAVKTIEDKQRTILDQRDREAKAAVQTTYYTIGGATILALLVVAGVGFLITRSITRPVARLLEGTVIIGRGKLEHRVRVETKDELGDLARAFNHMTEKRQQALGAIQDAVGQLTSSSAEVLSSTTEQAAGRRSKRRRCRRRWPRWTR